MQFVKALIFAVLVIPSAAVSFLTWARPMWIDDRDRRRMDHWAGIASPEMEPHWQRFWSQWYNPHIWNNLGSEWARLDPQRAFKYTAFHIVLSFIVGVVLLL